MEILKVLIADDHKIIHLGLTAILRKLRPNATFEYAMDFASVLKLANEHSFDLLVMDVNMPAGNFQTTLEFVKRVQPAMKVMVFSSADEALFAPRLILQGADGFLNKLSNEQEIEMGLQSILNAGSYLSSQVKDTFVRNLLNKGKSFQNPLNVLTDRELEIAALLIQGDTLKLISKKLFIHISTISTHKTRIFKKLDISSIPELIEIFKIYHST